MVINIIKILANWFITPLNVVAVQRSLVTQYEFRRNSKGLAILFIGRRLHLSSLKKHIFQCYRSFG